MDKLIVSLEVPEARSIEERAAREEWLPDKIFEVCALKPLNQFSVRP